MFNFLYDYFFYYINQAISYLINTISNYFKTKEPITVERELKESSIDSKLEWGSLDHEFYEKINLMISDFFDSIENSINQEAYESQLRYIDRYTEEIMRINPAMNMKTLAKLLKIPERLKTLNLQHCKDISDEISQDLNLEYLEEITIHNSNISNNNLLRLIDSTTNLKELRMSGCENISDEILNKLNFDKLKNLEMLYFDFNMMSPNNLFRGIMRLKKLKKLGLVNYKNINFDMHEELSLGFLEEIFIVDSKISVNNIAKILKNLENLKDISFDNCEILDDELSEELSLNYLENIEFKNTKISTSTIANMLKNSRNLKTLDLLNSEIINDEIVEELSLESLEYINFNSSNISKSNFLKLLKNSNRLKHLCLDRNSIIDSDAVDEMNLEHLESLEVKGFSDSKALVKIFQKANELKKLYLSRFNVLNDEIVDSLNIDFLEEVRCDDNLNSINYLQLIKNTKNLKEFDFTNHKRMLDEIDENWKLDKLEKVTISSKDLTENNTKSLSKYAKNLKKIILEGELSEEIIDILKFDTVTTLKLSDSNIDISWLQKLLINFKSLNVLTLYNCNIAGEITGELKYNQLECFNTSSCNITAENLLKLINSSNLKTLSLQDINKNDLDFVDKYYLKKILEKAKGVKHLLVCFGMSNDELVYALKDTSVTELHNGPNPYSLAVLSENKKRKYDRLHLVGEILARKNGSAINYNAVQRVVSYMYGNPMKRMHDENKPHQSDILTNVAYDRMMEKKRP